MARRSQFHHESPVPLPLKAPRTDDNAKSKLHVTPSTRKRAYLRKVENIRSQISSQKALIDGLAGKRAAAAASARKKADIFAQRALLIGPIAAIPASKRKEIIAAVKDGAHSTPGPGQYDHISTLSCRGGKFIASNAKGLMDMIEDTAARSGPGPAAYNISSDEFWMNGVKLPAECAAYAVK